MCMCGCSNISRLLMRRLQEKVESGEIDGNNLYELNETPLSKSKQDLSSADSITNFNCTDTMKAKQHSTVFGIKGRIINP